MKLRSIIKSKKAGLEISVNAIVILIFAVTILSLGIVFIRKIFSGVQEQFTNVAGDTKARLREELANSNARLTLELTDITIKKGDKKVIAFAVKNELERSYTFTFMGAGTITKTGEWDKEGSAITCYASAEDEVDFGKIKFKTLKSQLIKEGEVGIYNLEISVGRDVKTGIYYCGFVIEDPNEENPNDPKGVQPYADVRFTINVET